MQYKNPLSTFRLAGVIVMLAACELVAGCGRAVSGPVQQALGDAVPQIDFVFPGAEPTGWVDVRPVIQQESLYAAQATVEFRWVDYRNYSTEIDTMLAADDAPDAFVCSQPQQFYPDFRVLAREGLLTDISDLFPDRAPALFAQYSDEALGFASIDGALYAVPSLEPHARTSYVVADAGVMHRYGIGDIYDLDDYERFLRTAKQEGEAIPGTIINVTNVLDLFGRLSGYVTFDHDLRLVYRYDDPQMHVVPWERTPEFASVIKRLIAWYETGLLVAQADFTKAASFIDYSDVLGSDAAVESEITISSSTTSSSGSVTETDPVQKQARMITLRPDVPIYLENPMGQFFWNGSFAFSAHSQHTGEALAFLNWVQESRDNYRLTVYGIEGKHYQLRDGMPLWPQDTSYRDRAYYRWDGSWGFLNLHYEVPGAEDGHDPGTDPRTAPARLATYAPHGSAQITDYGELGPAATDRIRAFTRLDYDLTRGIIENARDMDYYFGALDARDTEGLVMLAQQAILRSK